MTIQRAAILYPVNTTTVDTGVGIDIRLLDSAEAGANDDTQTVQWTHTQDSADRTFDPGTGAVTTSDPVGTGTPTFGWALRLPEDMTPADDTNCDAVLLAGTIAISLSVALNQSGGTYAGGTYGPIFRISCWRYNIAANTATRIGSISGNGGALTWDYTPISGDLGTFKTATINFGVASQVTFSAGEVLLLEIGLGTSTVPNPSVGTATWTATLRVDNSGTNAAFAAGQGIRQTCALSGSLVGAGVPTRGANQITMARSAVAAGVITSSKAVVASKSFNLVGAGVVSQSHATVAARSFDLAAAGVVTQSHATIAARSFDLTGAGEVTASRAVVAAKTADIVGAGAASFSKAVIASKSFNLVGAGVVTEAHPVQAFRTFSLVGAGAITGTITLPIDEVPEGGGGTTMIRRKKVIVYDKV